MNPEQKTESEIKRGETKICLSIAGLDPSGGAGIIADIKTFSAFGCFAASAVTSITFQNTQGVFGAVHQTAETVGRQIETVLDDYAVSALKTGMLPTGEIIKETARIISEYELKNFVIDPVICSTSGFNLIDDEALKALIKHLFPLSEIITPNIPEAERIAQISIKNESDIARAARIMQNFGARNVLIKGGHLPFTVTEAKILVSTENHLPSDKESVQENRQPSTKNKIARDYLFSGDDLKIFEAGFVDTTSTHGTGCALASAIAANLALGKSLAGSVETAKKFVTGAIRAAPNIGKGNSPIKI